MTTRKCDERPKSPTVNLLRASARGRLDKVIQAINEGAELAVNKNGHTALHVASHKGFLDIVRVLLSAGCDLDIQDDKGNTALHRACIAGHDNVVRRLIEEGCCIDRQNKQGDSALHEASSRGYSRCVLALIEGHANIGLKNKNGDSPIHLACANAHSGSLRLLLSYYPHASPKNFQEDTPLHIAVRYGHVTCTRVLISARCSINLQNNQGNTALHIATIAQHRKLVRVLLDAHAEVGTIKNHDGKTALDIALDGEDGETTMMLRSGARPKVKKERGRGRLRGRDNEFRRSHSEPRCDTKKQNHFSAGSPPLDRTDRHFNAVDRQHRATLPNKRNNRAKAKWRRKIRQKSKSTGNGIDLLEKHQQQIHKSPYVVPQLYSLYRDESGVVRQKPVLNQSLDQTPHIVKKLAATVEDTKGELLQEIRKTNQLLESRLDFIENETNFKVARLDQITKERINAERIKCLHRIDRRATLERSRSKRAASVPSRHSADETISIEPGSSMGEGEKEDAPKDFAESEIGMLLPYQTIKIHREDGSATGFCPSALQSIERFNPSINTNHHLQCLNASDSAYGSLSPPNRVDLSLSSWKQSQLPNIACNSNTAQRRTGTHSTLKSTENLDFFNKDNDANAMWQDNDQTLERREDLCERGSVKMREKQKIELEEKLAQLELQVKILQTEVSKESC